MSTKQYDFLVFIGRMQPPTNAHIANIKEALELADKVIILFGSSFQPRTIKNPWKWTERANMVLAHLEVIDHPRVIFAGVHDHRYNDQSWVQEVQQIVKRNTYSVDTPNIGIIGCKKDATSFYLDFFPQWAFVELPAIPDINATDIRDQYFEGTLFQWRDKDLISSELKEYLRQWSQTEEYKSLVEEFNHIKAYKKAWENAPYPPTFVTGDAVIIQSGHILLIQRRAAPGKGLWALPGGFIDQDEFIFEGVLREIQEETKLKVTPNILRGCLRGEKVFDKPNRSLRGRTITHAFTFELAPGQLTKVKGGDDAAKAKWFLIDDVLEMEEELFEDHINIISWGLNVCK